jgi:glycosyltransferase involved in cell wall biosynthesis
MKILNLIQCANLGGMEQASLRLMQSLQARGHELQLLSLNPIGKLGPLLQAADISHEGLPYAGKGGWRILPSLRRKLHGYKADALIMTGHHLLAMPALGDFAKGRRILAIHFHHAGVKPDWQWRLIYQLACSRFQAITFPSDFIRREAEHIYPSVAGLAHTIRIPLNMPVPLTPEQKQAARRTLGLPPDVPVIGNAGWLIPRKRFDVFLQTAAIIAARCPEAHFVIAGDGEERQRLEALAASLNLTGRLTWTGWVQNMEIFYHSLDVLLFNSDWDAMGLTPLEAMSHGVPVVASVVNGGLKEILSSPEWGFLLDRHESETLASAAVHLLQNPTAAMQTSIAGRERVRLVSNPEAIAIEHEKLWQSRS